MAMPPPLVKKDEDQEDECKLPEIGGIGVASLLLQSSRRGARSRPPRVVSTACVLPFGLGCGCLPSEVHPPSRSGEAGAPS